MAFPYRIVSLTARHASVHGGRGCAMLAAAAMHGALIACLAGMPDAPAAQDIAVPFSVTLLEVSAVPAPVPMPEEAAAPAAPAMPGNAAPSRPQPKRALPSQPDKLLKTEVLAAEPAEARPAVAAPIMPARFEAAYLRNSQPDYPLLSRRLGEQGDVTLRVYVTPEGRAEEVRLHTSSGFARLDKAAEAAVRQWRFIPARQGEALIASWVGVPVRFVLQ